MGKKRRSRAFKESDQVIHFEEERQKRKEKRQQAVEKRKGKPDSSAQISERRATKMHRRRLIYGVIAIFMIAVVGFSIYSVVSLRIERVAAEEQTAALLKEKARLEKDLQQVDSDEYIENEARGGLHMIKPGETIYVLENEKKDGSATSGSGVLQESTEGALKKK